MPENDNWPFSGNSKIMGMRLPEYLEWSSGQGSFPQALLLPPIQRGFVWKPLQIAQLWDSLLRGMPIGSLMVSKLSAGQTATDIGEKGRKSDEIKTAAIGLLDGQQRTLAMLLGFKNSPSSDYCVWIDLGETGQAGSPFELRITTRTQPFGFQRHWHSKLSRHDRREARKDYDKDHPDDIMVRDFDLFGYRDVRPWKARKSAKSAELCVPIKDLWAAFRNDENQGIAQYVKEKLPEQAESEVLHANLARLHGAFKRLGLIEVPLILIPEHISKPPKDDLSVQADAPAPLTLLFERIGRNGASLSAEDLLFSMIKQQWPEAHDLVEGIHRGKVGYLMSATDYVMTAYRLASAEKGLTDTPRPNPNDFHRHLGVLIGKDAPNGSVASQDKKDEVPTAPLRSYLKKGKLSSAFDSLYDALKYKGYGDIGLPDMMLPHLSRGLIQVLLRWFMLNDPDEKTVAENRNGIVAFALFWYLCIRNEDKASKKAFEMIQKGAFPAKDIYRALSKDETGLAMPLISRDRLNVILVTESSSLLRSDDEIFKKNPDGVLIAKNQERDLYKRFCWWRKPVLLWIQREYVQETFNADFAGLIDEDAVPYDYDHLCPQNHWGADWRRIDGNSKGKLSKEVGDRFNRGRSDVGNCIGNLHVLDSSLNRSFGDAPLEWKLKESLKAEIKWSVTDSLLYHAAGHENLWKKASPYTSAGEPDTPVEECWSWNEDRLQAFQEAVRLRASCLYLQYFDACAHLMIGD